MAPKKRKNDSDSEDELKAIKKKKEGQNGSHSVEDETLADNENQPVFCTAEPIRDRDASTEETEEKDSDCGDDDIINKGPDFPPGEILISGGMNWDLVGRHRLPKNVKNMGGPNLWQPHRIGQFKGVKIRNIISGCSACHSIIITENGQALSFGRNDRGQLGHGDVGVRRDVPTLLESLKDVKIVGGSCGKNHTVLVSDNGRVFAFGDNKMGQLGLGHQSPTVPSPTEIHIEKYDDKGPFKKAACGGEFTMILTVKGTLYSFGLPEYGQLGHNTDGKFFVASNKLSYNCELKPRPVKCFFEVKDNRYINIPDVNVVDVACGGNHTIAIDSMHRVFSWGWGGYGRLGHCDTKDEMVPRLIKNFDGHKARAAWFCEAGSSFSMVVTVPFSSSASSPATNTIYFFGQNKPTGEANMYPKPIQDFYGWEVRSVGCAHKSVVVAGDDSVASWGPNPTYGELGYGEFAAKSSSVPKVVSTIDGIRIQKVVCGYGHCMMIARVESDEDREMLEKIKVYNPTALPSA